jgi:hypothetical protein
MHGPKAGYRNRDRLTPSRKQRLINYERKIPARNPNMSKMMKWLIGGAVIIASAVVVVAVINSSSNGSGNVAARFGVPSARAAEPIGHIGTGKAAEAMEKAGNSDKYVFALFYREDNDQLTSARSLVESSQKKIVRKSEIVEINVTDPTEQDVVNKYGTSRAPMPLILLIAPNGAIMTGAPAAQLDENRLADAVGTKGSEQVIKAVQQKNMVVLCTQGKKTAGNAAAMRGVKDFVKDSKYSASTAVVTIDPSDPAEAKFLSKLNIDVNSPTAITTLLAPNGSVIGTFQGATTMDKLAASVQAAAAPKSGCGPAGCGGKPCGPTGGAAAAPQKAPMAVQPQSAQSKMQISKVPPPSTTAPATKNQGK